jgi:hypothetical protein
MKPLRTWLGRLGLFGALAIVSGCGGGDVPDPSADGEVAQLPDAAPPPPPVQPAPQPAAANVAAEDKAEDAKAEETTAQAPAAAPAPEPAGAGAAPPDRNSATAEMLALATKEQPAPAPSGDAAPAAAAGGAPGPGGGPPNMGPGAPGAMGPNAGGPNPGMNPGQMQGQMMQGQMRQQMQQQGMQAQMQARMPGAPGGPGGGMMGAGGGPGMPGNENAKPADFRSPEGAVQAFLDALKARNLDRLTEATALRAQNESAPHNKEMFKRIFDGSLSKAEIDELAAMLEDYRITSENPPKSSGRLDVILSKRGTNNNMTTIKITVRREKKGGGVSDISYPAEFKNPRMGPIRSQPKR